VPYELDGVFSDVDMILEDYDLLRLTSLGAAICLVIVSLYV